MAPIDLHSCGLLSSGLIPVAGQRALAELKPREAARCVGLSTDVWMELWDRPSTPGCSTGQLRAQLVVEPVPPELFEVVLDWLSCGKGVPASRRLALMRVLTSSGLGNATWAQLTAILDRVGSPDDRRSVAACEWIPAPLRRSAARSLSFENRVRFVLNVRGSDAGDAELLLVRPAEMPTPQSLGVVAALAALRPGVAELAAEQLVSYDRNRGDSALWGCALGAWHFDDSYVSMIWSMARNRRADRFRKAAGCLLMDPSIPSAIASELRPTTQVRDPWLDRRVTRNGELRPDDMVEAAQYIGTEQGWVLAGRLCGHPYLFEHVGRRTANGPYDLWLELRGAAARRPVTLGDVTRLQRVQHAPTPAWAPAVAAAAGDSQTRWRFAFELLAGAHDGFAVADMVAAI